MKTNKAEQKNRWAKILSFFLKFAILFAAIQLAGVVVEGYDRWFNGKSVAVNFIVTFVFYFAAMLIIDRLIPAIRKRFVNSNNNHQNRKSEK